MGQRNTRVHRHEGRVAPRSTTWRRGKGTSPAVRDKIEERDRDGRRWCASSAWGRWEAGRTPRHVHWPLSIGSGFAGASRGRSGAHTGGMGSRVLPGTPYFTHHDGLNKSGCSNLQHPGGDLGQGIRLDASFSERQLREPHNSSLPKSETKFSSVPGNALSNALVNIPL